MANHKVLRDLLHILITEKSVKAQLVCRREKEREGERKREERKQAEVARGERMDGM